MRVFVICTGRCGSLSFATACRHLTNFTVGHETPTKDLVFPDWHIEVSAPLHARIFDLIEMYPDAMFVHLIREEEACVRSLARMGRGETMRHFSSMYSVLCCDSPEEAAGIFYRFVNRVIRSFLSLVPVRRRMTMRLESIQSEWYRFLTWIDADGDLAASKKTWETPINTGIERGEI